MSELKPCPFCEPRDECKVFTEHYDCNFMPCCVSTSCGLTGPLRQTEAEAIESWNTRTPDKEAAWKVWKHLSDKFDIFDFQTDEDREEFEQYWQSKHGVKE